MTQENLFTGESSELLNKAISEHFLRQGQVDVAERLIRVSENWNRIMVKIMATESTCL